MSSLNLDVYMPIIILIGLAIAVAGGSLLVGGIIRPHNPNKLKESPYECGEEPVGSAWANFNVRFYVIALIFIIFDVESALMFPVASVFKRFNEIGTWWNTSTFCFDFCFSFSCRHRLLLEKRRS